MKYSLGKTDTKIILGAVASQDEILSNKPDVVIIAAGSRCCIPNIPGINRSFVFDVRTVYKNMPPEFGADIVVLGGGDIGCETADMLSLKSKNVSIIEVCEQPLARMKEIPWQELLNRLKEKGVKIFITCRTINIEKGRVVIEDKDGMEKALKADSVIVAAGSITENALFDSLQGKVQEIYLIGDAKEPGNLGSALRSAAEIGLKI